MSSSPISQKLFLMLFSAGLFALLLNACQSQNGLNARNRPAKPTIDWTTRRPLRASETDFKAALKKYSSEYNVSYCSRRLGKVKCHCYTPQTYDQPNGYCSPPVDPNTIHGAQHITFANDSDETDFVKAIGESFAK
mgnify:CR=1 FL=1